MRGSLIALKKVKNNANEKENEVVGENDGINFRFCKIYTLFQINFESKIAYGKYFLTFSKINSVFISQF